MSHAHHHHHRPYRKPSTSRPPPSDPRDVALLHTLPFVTKRLRRRARVLDAGCGSGRLAGALAHLGHEVTAIDVHPDAVQAARAAGVPAIQADVRTYEDAPFDAVVFSRSLHHVHPLGPALDRVHALLKPGGWLLLEEFAYTTIDRATALWFYDGMELLSAAGRVRMPDHWHRPHPDPRERWKLWHRHDPPLHSAAVMQRAVARRFEVKSTARLHYLYRYACEFLERDPIGGATARWLFEREQAHVKAGLLKPIGFRLEARR